MKSKLSRNIAASLMRVGANLVISLALPAYLVTRLPVSVYSAWVLILQLGAYVSFLELGIQTSVAKFVAEHEARGDEETAGQYASAGLAMTNFMAACGVILTGALAWQVPNLFSTMPVSLQTDARVSVMLVGLSLSFLLSCSVFSAVFLGLQRYGIPSLILVGNRILVTVSVWLAVMFHGGLRVMAAAFSLVNVISALVQVLCWKRMAARIRISFSRVNRIIFRQMIQYSAILAIWSVGMLLVSGLDVTIVGHFDYRQTGFYAIAVMPTNFLLLIISSVVGPVMPASSALSTRRSPAEMGAVLIRISRYAILLLLLIGLPLILFGHSILRLWVGAYYASNSLLYMRILVTANIIRNACLPYATMVIATGRQKAATVAVVSEAAVNLLSSVFLASRFGAIGVAYGTLLGSIVSVLLHFLLSMSATKTTLSFSRRTLLGGAFLRGGIVAIPSLFLVWLHDNAKVLRLEPEIFMGWLVLTLGLAWFFVLNSEDREEFVSRAASLLRASSAPA
jgi:O-antigen/teichoic acid export membrane protein